MSKIIEVEETTKKSSESIQEVEATRLPANGNNDEAQPAAQTVIADQSHPRKNKGKYIPQRY